MSHAFGWGRNEFLKYGGYPGPAELIKDPERWQSYIHDSIIEPIISKDILSLTEIRKPALFRQTLEICCAYPAQQMSYQKIVGQLQDGGNVATVKHYLDLLSAAFIVRLLPKYTGSLIREKTLSPKILISGQALLHANRSPREVDTDGTWRGRAVENAVGSVLVRHFPKVSYWQRQDAEVDFIVEHQNKTFAVEVKSGRPRKRSGLAALMKQEPELIPITITEDSVEQVLMDDLSCFATQP